MRRRSAIAVLCLSSGVLWIVPGTVADCVPAPSGRPQSAPAKPLVLLDLASFLPRDGDVPGWSPKGGALVYRGEDLFTYIDGGADVYNEYGFRQVVVQDYEDSAQRTLTLEVFEMTDAAAAFGIFTFKTSPRGTEAALGDGGRLEDYYLNFWKGSALVTVTGFDESPESVGGVRRIAEAVDRRIPLRGEKPPFAAAFPPDWAGRGGLKYLRGPLGLRNLHPVFARQTVRFREAVAGWPADGRLAVVLRGQTELETKTAFSDAQKGFSSNPAFSGYQAGEGRFEAQDSRGHFIQARLLDGCLALLVGNEELSGSEGIWERLRGAFSRKPRPAL